VEIAQSGEAVTAPVYREILAALEKGAISGDANPSRSVR
jgi:hypothetical protein